MAEKLASIKKVGGGGGGIKCWKSDRFIGGNQVSNPNYKTVSIANKCPIYQKITADNLLLVCDGYVTSVYSTNDSNSSAMSVSIYSYDPTTGNVVVRNSWGFSYGNHETHLYFYIYVFDVPLSEIMQN